jgi:hypothetical protein
MQSAEKYTGTRTESANGKATLGLACPSLEEIAPELSPPALGAGDGVARPGAGWAHVALTQTDGKSGWKCSFCQKEFAGRG